MKPSLHPTSLLTFAQLIPVSKSETESEKLTIERSGPTLSFSRWPTLIQAVVVNPRAMSRLCSTDQNSSTPENRQLSTSPIRSILCHRFPARTHILLLVALESLILKTEAFPLPIFVLDSFPLSPRDSSLVFSSVPTPVLRIKEQPWVRLHLYQSANTPSRSHQSLHPTNDLLQPTRMSFLTTTTMMMTMTIYSLVMLMNLLLVLKNLLSPPNKQAVLLARIALRVPTRSCLLWSPTGTQMLV